jgi:hypothetical protein
MRTLAKPGHIWKDSTECDLKEYAQDRVELLVNMFIKIPAL